MVPSSEVVQAIRLVASELCVSSALVVATWQFIVPFFRFGSSPMSSFHSFV